MNKKRIIWLFISAVILSPMLFYPFNGDHAQFIQAARTIDQGGKIFVDFIDLKPPFLYYMYWIIRELVGESPIACRVFDFVIQLLTYLLIFIVIERKTGNSLTAGTAISLYAILYVSLGHAGGFQPAMFAGLATAALYCLSVMYEDRKSHKKEIAEILIFGFIIGLITGIKYTYGILGVILVILYLTDSRYSVKEKLFRVTFLTIISLIVFAATMFPLLDGEVFTGFVEISKVLSAYASRPPWSPELIQKILKTFAEVFADKYSLLITGSSILAILIYFIERKNFSEEKRRFFETTIIFTGLLFFSAVVEKKLFTYHFVRMFPVWLTLSAFGIVSFYEVVRRNYSKFALYQKVLVVGIILLAMMFSPAVRYLYRFRAPMLYLTDKESYNVLFSDRVNHRYDHGEIQEVAGIINDMRPEFDDEKPFLMAVQTSNAIINYLTPEYRHSRFGQSQFYFSVEAPEVWQEAACEEIRDADVLFFALRDQSKGLFGHSYKYDREYSSHDFIFKLETDLSNRIEGIVNENFEEEYSGNLYKVFRKKD